MNESHEPEAESEPLPKRFVDAAKTCHEPPSVPREAMWQAIERARAVSSRDGVHDIASAPQRLRARRSIPSWAWAAAAAALIAVGYAAGRTGSRPEAMQVATSERRAPSLADQIAANEHFARAEVLLTQFTLHGSSVQVDTAFARWSRRLLSDTRLLLDSPAAVDPNRKALLEDLELILLQIGRTSDPNDFEERTLTRDALRDTDLLHKLRMSVPSGTSSPRS